MIKKNILFTLFVFGTLSCSTKEQYIIKLSPQTYESSQQSTKISNKLAINSLKLPSYLLKYPIAKQISATQIIYLDTHRWAEPLDDALKRELIAYLQHNALHYEVVEYPWGTLPNITVDITLNDFIASQKKVTLHATVKTYNRKNNQSHIYKISKKENFSGEDKDIAQAMNQIFKKFSIEIHNLLNKK
ncbi:MAG: ABC-type transport auxiliary lipoprotein family protein [Campylobacterota bacterium]|nr:ABC-type transport auxiliary lipoprotein family protein [Campylobacterota bacterium]